MGKHSIVLLLAFFCALSSCKRNKAESTPEEQKKAADEEAKRVKLTTIPTKEQLSKKPFIKGKAVYFEQVAGTWSKENSFYGNSQGYDKIRDRLTYSLDAAVTVILKPTCKNQPSGDYEGIPAYVEHCDVLLIDPSIPAIFYRAHLQGKLDNVATLKKGTTSVEALVTTAQLYDFIADLEQK